ncbi:MAG: hypothetical protein DRN49_05545 [Thaumarchaeota archaeon]|nr:MAG: hypothetical protein DRN49_05545 [Nitrososphaerota archaeon]
MTDLAIIIASPRKYFHLVNALKRYGVKFISLMPGDEIPRSIKVVITDNKSFTTKPDLAVVHLGEDYERAVFEAMCALRGRENFDMLIIGVDPGATHGLAALADGQPVLLRTFRSISSLIKCIERLIATFPAKTKVIRVGRGAGEWTKKVVEKLESLNAIFCVKIELVSEHLPPPPWIKEYSLPDDVKSALSIALAKSAGSILRGDGSENEASKVENS